MHSDSLKKDWVTILISTSGVLLTLAVAFLGLLHTTLDEFNWPIIIVDIFGIMAILAFVGASYYGLSALGSLILASIAKEAHDYEGKSRADGKATGSAMAAQNCFLAGLTLLVLAGFAVVIVLNWISFDDGGTHKLFCHTCTVSR